MGIIPFDPTPTGIWSKSACANCSLTGNTSFSDKFVLIKRTPQLMSKPTPPIKIQYKLRMESQTMQFAKMSTQAAYTLNIVSMPSYAPAASKGRPHPPSTQGFSGHYAQLRDSTQRTFVYLKLGSDRGHL